MTGPSVPAAQAAREAVRLVARAHAPDRYLAALLAAHAVRDDLVTLAAFAGEIARIPVEVSEPMLGEIRLQWWRDAMLAGERGEVTGHPVADALAVVMARHGLAREPLLALLEARSLELYPDPLPDQAALDGWLEQTEGALYAAALRICGSADDATSSASSAARNAGRAYGLAMLLRRVPRALARRCLLLPSDRLLAAGLMPDQPRSPDSCAAITAVTADIAVAAMAEIAELRTNPRWRSRRTRAALLPVAMVRPYLRGLQPVTTDRLVAPTDPTPLGRVARLWWAHRTGAL